MVSIMQEMGLKMDKHHHEVCRWSPPSTIKDIDRRCGRLRCAVARYVSIHVNVSGGYRHVPRNSATQATNVAYKDPYVLVDLISNYCRIYAFDWYKYR